MAAFGQQHFLLKKLVSKFNFDGTTESEAESRRALELIGSSGSSSSGSGSSISGGGDDGGHRNSNGDYCIHEEQHHWGTQVLLKDDMKGFVVKIYPWRDLWISSVVEFEIELPEQFPKERPIGKCIKIDESLRTDQRLLMVVEEEPPAVSSSSYDSEDDEWGAGCSDEDEEDDDDDDDGLKEEKPKLYKSRIDTDGTVHTNLFESMYMGWLEFYDIEVVIHTLRCLFRKTEPEIAPDISHFEPSKPVKVTVESGVYEEQGPRKSMEDRVCIEDCRFVPFQDAGENLSPSTSTLSGKESPTSFAFMSPKHSEHSEVDMEALDGGDDDEDEDGGKKLVQYPITDDEDEDADCEDEDEDEGEHVQVGYLEQQQQHHQLQQENQELEQQELKMAAGEIDHLKLGLQSLSLDQKETQKHMDTEKHAGRNVAFHAVLDGHGGWKAAEKASKFVEKYFFQELKNETVGIERALYNAVILTEEELVKIAKEEKETDGFLADTSGCTLCAVAIDLDHGVLFCANVGDSRALLSRDGNAIELSLDHKATRPDEIARIVHTGGFVSYGRVLGMLAVSRALGDPEMKSPNQLISSIPSITKIELSQKDEFVLVACDGLYDVISNQQAVELAGSGLQVTAGDTEQVCISLVHHALRDLGSQDNVSVILIKLNFSPSGSGASLPVEVVQDQEIHYPNKQGSPFLSPTVQAAALASRRRKNSATSKDP